jgi:hypothetical protein
LNSHAPDLRTAHPDRGGLKTLAYKYEGLTERVSDLERQVEDLELERQLKEQAEDREIARQAEDLIAAGETEGITLRETLDLHLRQAPRPEP